MPRRLGVVLTFAAIFGSGGLVRAQSSASFPDPDAPSAPPATRRPQAPTAESPPRRDAPRPTPPSEPSSPPSTPTPSSPQDPAPQGAAPQGAVPQDAPAPRPAVTAAPPAPLVPSEEPSPSIGAAPTRLDLVAAPGPLGTFRPPVLPAYAGMDPPDGYHAESSSNRGLVWGGALTWGIGYAAALGYGMSDGFSGGVGTLAIPVLGPWLAMGKQSFDCDVPDTLESARSCQDQSFGTAKTLAVLGTVGLVQAVGGTLLLVGLFDRREQWVRDDLGIAELRLDAMPLAGGGGAWLQGRF